MHMPAHTNTNAHTHTQNTHSIPVVCFRAFSKQGTREGLDLPWPSKTSENCKALAKFSEKVDPAMLRLQVVVPWISQTKCPALPPWCFFGLAFGASFQIRLINLCSNLCIYERIYTAATTFGDCSQVGSGNVCCENTSNSHGIASCRLLAQDDKEVGIWSTACNGIMISNGVVPFSCKFLSSRMCWKKCLQKILIKGN